MRSPFDTSIASARKLSDLEPVGIGARPTSALDEMESTVSEFYLLGSPEDIPLQELALDADLATSSISPGSNVRHSLAGDVASASRAHSDKVTYWSGRAKSPIVKRLVEAICNVSRPRSARGHSTQVRLPRRRGNSPPHSQ